MIRHGDRPGGCSVSLPAPVVALAVTMVQTACLALLVSPVGCAELLPPGLLAATSAAIALAAIAVATNAKHQAAVVAKAIPQPDL